MASFFGEVTALSSRAVEDEEEENYPIYSLNFELKEETSIKNLKCKLVVFSVGQIATAFTHSYLLPDEALLVSTIKCVNNRSVNDSILYTGFKACTQETTAASVFLVRPDLLICEVVEHVPEEISFDLCDLLFKHFTCMRALVLTTYPMAAYKCENYTLSEPFLKALATSQYLLSQSCNISRLQAPNFVTNVAAAVLAEFEVKKKPALCVVNFVDTNRVDSFNVQMFEEVLKENIVTDLGINSDANSRLINYVKTKQTAQSNLYT